MADWWGKAPCRHLRSYRPPSGSSGAAGPLLAASVAPGPQLGASAITSPSPSSSAAPGPDPAPAIPCRRPESIELAGDSHHFVQIQQRIRENTRKSKGGWAHCHIWQGRADFKVTTHSGPNPQRMNYGHWLQFELQFAPYRPIHKGYCGHDIPAQTLPQSLTTGCSLHLLFTDCALGKVSIQASIDLPYSTVSRQSAKLKEKWNEALITWNLTGYYYSNDHPGSFFL